ncbi:hypothetical protein DFA_05746 [Cavenderia fasciculata]|uniref:Ankyrin repeat-containing protein n=1 Tax=Cavenderia fasciculata TaxID=261658 RepID=F4PMG5_CACFS|nr:uncharacterized protein DFA_05746 [Cavenderia fasciculata]EGG23612.1 hypothetical protein DFA_05746 [Cavenderia fasciculata]|eukprot:XP_004361463.1 hypothetical protein DFA_05746 [Cavenderia fasciculata]
MATTIITFQSIYRMKYIRQLIFNHINDISNQLYKGSIFDGRERSSKGRDIIKLTLPRLEMVSRKRAITQYCQHHNATLDTLVHLLEWSPVVQIEWQYLKSNGRDIGNKEILEYLIKRCGDSSNDFLVWAMNSAINNGYLSTVKLIGSIDGLKLDKTTMNRAARVSIEIVKYLHENRTEGCSHYAMDNAASNGRLDIVKVSLIRYNIQFKLTEGCSKNAMDNAATNGHLEIVKFLHEHRQEGCNKVAMDHASRKGHLNVVRYLHEHRSEGATSSAMDWAACNKHIEVVKFLHFNRSEGCPKRTIRNACRSGLLEIASFLINVRKEKCDVKVLMAASTSGLYDIVKSILEQYGHQIGIESIENVIQQMSTSTSPQSEIIQLLESYLKQQQQRDHQE